MLHLTQTTQGTQEPHGIAMVGMGCWFGGYQSPREYWENILRFQWARRLVQDLALQSHEASEIKACLNLNQKDFQEQMLRFTASL